jgi:hypothetical protein
LTKTGHFLLPPLPCQSSAAVLHWKLTLINFRRTVNSMPSGEKLTEFTAWCQKNITGDEKGEAQIFLDHLFLAFGYTGGLKEAGATL